MKINLRIGIKIWGIIEIIIGSLVSTFAVLLFIHSYPLLNDPNHATGGSFGVAYGQIFIIIFLPLLITGIFTFLLKPLGRILHIIGCYLIIAATVAIVAINIYSLLKYEGIAYFKEEGVYLLTLIVPIAFFIIVPAIIIYLLTRPKVKEQFKRIKRGQSELNK